MAYCTYLNFSFVMNTHAVRMHQAIQHLGPKSFIQFNQVLMFFYNVLCTLYSQKAVVIFVFKLSRSPRSFKAEQLGIIQLVEFNSSAWHLPAWSDMRCKICLTVASKPANLASLFYGGALTIPGAIFFEHTIVSVCTFACSLVHSINAHMHIYIVFFFFTVHWS